MLVDLGSRVKSFFSLFCNTRSLSWALNSVLGAKGCIGENTNTLGDVHWYLPFMAGSNCINSVVSQVYNSESGTRSSLKVKTKFSDWLISSLKLRSVITNLPALRLQEIIRQLDKTNKRNEVEKMCFI